MSVGFLRALYLSPSYDSVLVCRASLFRSPWKMLWLEADDSVALGCFFRADCLTLALGAA